GNHICRVRARRCVDAFSCASLDYVLYLSCTVFFSSRRRHTRSKRDWSSDVCSSDLSLCYTAVSCLPRLALSLSTCSLTVWARSRLLPKTIQSARPPTLRRAPPLQHTKRQHAHIPACGNTDRNVFKTLVVP